MTSSAINISSNYCILQNITYVRAGGINLALDIYLPRDNIDQSSGKVKKTANRLATVVFFHGGGWVEGNKEGCCLHFLPYLERGMCVVSVAYRLGPDALAPAAVEDARLCN